MAVECIGKGIEAVAERQRGGWISPINKQMLVFGIKGSFATSRGLMSLVKRPHLKQRGHKHKPLMQMGTSELFYVLRLHFVHSPQLGQLRLPYENIYKRATGKQTHTRGWGVGVGDQQRMTSLRTNDKVMN